VLLLVYMGSDVVTNDGHNFGGKEKDRGNKLHCNLKFFSFRRVASDGGENRIGLVPWMPNPALNDLRQKQMTPSEFEEPIVTEETPLTSYGYRMRPSIDASGTTAEKTYGGGGRKMSTTSSVTISTVPTGTTAEKTYGGGGRRMSTTSSVTISAVPPMAAAPTAHGYFLPAAAGRMANGRVGYSAATAREDYRMGKCLE
jgi:hypothetical protein